MSGSRFGTKYLVAAINCTDLVLPYVGRLT